MHYKGYKQLLEIIMFSFSLCHIGAFIFFFFFFINLKKLFLNAS